MKTSASKTPKLPNAAVARRAEDVQEASKMQTLPIMAVKK
jgi:hypothetical protein